MKRINSHSKKDDNNNISCEEAIKRVFDYIDGYLSGKPLNELERHIDLCRGCLKKLDFQLKLKSRIARVKPAKVSEELNYRIKSLLNGI
jgi:anti-sigma factor (TIGR02949 family)